MAQNPFIDIDIEGMEETKKNFAKLEDKVQKRLMKASLKKAALIVLFETQQEVPVDEAKLLKSLDVKPFRRSRKVTDIGFSIETGTREELGIDPKDEYYYPAVIEFGRKAASKSMFKRRHRKSTESRVLQPNPYMWRGLQKARPKALKAIKDDLEKRVERTVRRMAKKGK